MLIYWRNAVEHCEKVPKVAFSALQIIQLATLFNDAETKAIKN